MEGKNMNHFESFLKGNQKETEPTKYVVSDRFLDENGKPIEWHIKPISTREDKQLKKVCSLKKDRLDFDQYSSKLVVASIVFPNLNDKQLQDSYNVLSGEALIEEMLRPGEYDKLLIEIQKINGYQQSMSELIEEAKN